MRLPLYAAIETRDGTLTKDGKVINMYAQKNADGSVDCVKRPGTTTVVDLPAGTGQGMVALGALSWAIVGDTVYSIPGGVGTALPGVGIANRRMITLNGNVLGSGPAPAIIKSDVDMWVMDTILPTITQVTDADYPTVTVPGIALLDGTYYVMDAALRIYGSDLNAPLAWNPLNLIQADSGLGQGVSIRRHLNYVTAFCSSGLQMFYNAANATGSPLLPLSNASFKVGCVDAYSIAGIGDDTIFMGKNQSKGRSIYALRGLSLESLSTPFIDKILDRSNLSSVYSFGLKISGHSLYLLTLADLNLTLVYDFTVGEWYVWASGATAASSFNPVFYVNAVDGSDLLLNATSGRVYSLSTSAYSDSESAIYCLIRTPIIDFGTIDRKPLSRLNLIGDTVSSTISVAYSDDDYATLSSSRSLDLSTKRKLLTRLGTLRRRSFDFVHTAATALRLRFMEFHSDAGA